MELLIFFGVLTAAIIVWGIIEGLMVDANTRASARYRAAHPPPTEPLTPEQEAAEGYVRALAAGNPPSSDRWDVGGDLYRYHVKGIGRDPNEPWKGSMPW